LYYADLSVKYCRRTIFSQFIMGKNWRYQRGNQKPKSKDRQYNI